MFIKRKKFFVLLVCLGISEISYATNPDDDCRGPISPVEKDHIDACQDGNTLFAHGWCNLSVDDRFPNTIKLKDGGFSTLFCREDINEYSCSDFDGIWGEAHSGSNGNQFTCRGPRYNFDIVNKTSYAIKAVYYDEPLYNEAHATDHSGYIVTNYTASGETLQTNPNITTNEQALVVDPEYGKGHSGTIGTLAIFSPDINDDHSDYGIALATIQQHDPQGGHNKYRRYIYNLSSSNENHGRQSPKQFSQAACVLTPNSDKQYATYDNKKAIMSPPGKSFLLPNFIEAKIDFCVNNSSSKQNESVSYSYSVDSFQNLNTTNTRLVPNIDGTSGYISNPVGFKGTITYNNEAEAGEKCIPYNFVIKTNSADCSSFENNLPQSAINNASLNVSVSTPEAAPHYLKLKFNSQVSKEPDNVNAIYTMILDSGSDTNFSFAGWSTKFMTCSSGGICQAKIVYKEQ